MRVFNNGRHRTGSSSYRHPRNGSTTIESIPEIPGEESPPPTRNVTTSSSNRPTFAWPFTAQSMAGSSHRHSTQHSTTQHSTQQSTQHSAQNSRSTSFLRRNSGWINLRPASSVLGSDIIPDYVVNFMRGETPESLARKQQEREGGSRGAEPGHTRNQHSQVAEFFSSHSRMGSRGNLEDMLGNGKKGSFLKRFMSGWRGGIVLNMSLAFAILLAAIVCVVVAVTTGRLEAEPTTMLQGTCGRVSSIDLGSHVLLNVFAVFFIVCANYVGQVLVSPTRTEVAAAHNKQKALDIGIPSVRNLKAISAGRALLSALIIVMAVGTQVVYNSILFTTRNDDGASCELMLNGALLGAVAILNLVFILGLAAALARPASNNPLVTVGDAIASFIMEADQATEGACLVTKADITSGRWGCGEARYWFSQTHRWIAVPSKVRWVGWFVTWLLPTGMAGAMLGMALVDGPSNAFESFAKPTVTYALPLSIPRLGESMVLALPHLLLATLYFSTNAILTVFYLAREFSQFAIPGNFCALRISSGQPLGAQTTSYYLSLPRPLSWVLFLLFVAKGFMLSQSFHLTTLDSTPSISLNPLPLVILIGLLAVTAAMVLGLSLRRSDIGPASDEGRRPGNPLSLKGGSCSAVISARCHRSAAEGADIAALPLTWGVVTEGKVGHAAFSSRDVEPLTVAKAYA